ncbi:hypothetical protein ACSX1A_17445 [Pontibacter sp. MBLB2868]|uniref:hypothetical protein n=1 Tax=Pontibacter sp. MBLB2868 TaxID=3451555 RepID=UPI003F7536FC
MNDKPMTFAELRLEADGNQKITYLMLLSTREWQEKRLEVIRRDHHCCTKCGKGETFSEFDEERQETWHFWPHHNTGDWVIGKDGKSHYWKLDEPVFDFIVADKHYHMQVHHLCYIRNRLPWDYTDDCLVTLCNWCHWEFHQEHEVLVFEEDEVSLAEGMEPCFRCNGVGSFPEYNHVQGGACFRCGGERYERPLVEVR